MPRTARASVGDYCYHVINRGNARAEVFHGTLLNSQIPIRTEHWVSLSLVSSRQTPVHPAATRLPIISFGA